MTPTDLRKELERRGLSIRRAAPILGVHYVTLAQYLTGAMPITQTRSDSLRVRFMEYDGDPWLAQDRKLAQTQSKRRA